MLHMFYLNGKAYKNRLQSREHTYKIPCLIHETSAGEEGEHLRNLYQKCFEFTPYRWFINFFDVVLKVDEKGKWYSIILCDMIIDLTLGFLSYGQALYTLAMEA